MAAEATAILATGNEDQERTVNPSLIAVTVTLANLMELLDTAIANVSLPHIAGGLATSYDESTWVVTSYLVANAVVLPFSAWLSRVFGRKNYYNGRLRRQPVPLSHLLKGVLCYGERRNVNEPPASGVCNIATLCAISV